MQAINQPMKLGSSWNKPRSRRPLSHTARAWLVWTVSAVFVLFQFFIQLSSGEIVSGVMHSFMISAFSAGIVTSSYYYVYVLLQAPAGLLVDRYGPRRLLALGAFVLAVGCGGFALSSTVTFAILARVLMGAGAAFAFVGCLNLIARWFPANRFALMTAIAEMFGMLGSIVGGLFLAAMISHYGWRQCMWFSTAIAMMLSVALWRIVRDRPHSYSLDSESDDHAFLPEVKSLLRQPIVWMNAMYSGLVFAVVTVFVAMWGVPFLQTSYHLSLLSATSVTDFAFIGIAVACPLVGYIDAQTQLRSFILSLFPVLGAVCLFVILLVPGLSVWMLYSLMLALGMTLSCYFLTFVIGNQVASLKTQGTSLGLVNMVSVGTAPLLQPLVGAILDHYHHSMAVQHDFSSYQAALLLVPVCLLIAAVIGYFLPARRSSP